MDGLATHFNLGYLEPIALLLDFGAFTKAEAEWPQFYHHYKVNLLDAVSVVCWSQLFTKAIIKIQMI